MRHDVDSALAFYADSGDVAVDDELDFLAADEPEFCPVCSAELVEYDHDPFALHCPVCDHLDR